MIPLTILAAGSALLAWLRWRPSRHPQSINRYRKGQMRE